MGNGERPMSAPAELDGLQRILGHRRTHLLTSRNTHLAETRELEAQLEESLHALDYAEQHNEPIFAAASKVAAIQQRLDHLRGRQSEENPKRRAAWLEHLVKTGAIGASDGGPSVLEREAKHDRQHRASGAKVTFPIID